MQQMRDQIQARIDAQQLQELRRRYWERLLRATVEMSEDQLRAALRHRSPDRRFAAAYVVGERFLEWQDDLIPLLEDRSEAVRQGARRSLIILSFLALNPDEAQRIRSPQDSEPVTPLSDLNRPVDYGPEPGARPAARSQAAKQWKEWWAGHKDLSARQTDSLPGETSR